MKLFSIGFTHKTAPEFFDLLIRNKVRIVYDVRASNTSQLAGFTKESDLPYFLKTIADIEYIYWKEAATEKDLLKQWRHEEITWPEYERQFKAMLKKKKVSDMYTPEQLDHGCLLCSEATPEFSHCRLVAEYLKEKNPDIEIIYL